MSQPITPRYYANTVVCQTISIHYNPTWDGTSWVTPPANIEVQAFGILTEDGNSVSRADVTIPASTLPTDGQDALQLLLQYIETGLSTKYST